MVKYTETVNSITKTYQAPSVLLLLDLYTAIHDQQRLMREERDKACKVNVTDKAFCKKAAA